MIFFPLQNRLMKRIKKAGDGGLPDEHGVVKGKKKMNFTFTKKIKFQFTSEIRVA